MRSTLIRLPRRLRQDVAVGLVAAAVFSGLAACHAGGTRSSAHGVNCWGIRRQSPQQRGDLQPASCWRV